MSSFAFYSAAPVLPLNNPIPPPRESRRSVNTIADLDTQFFFPEAARVARLRRRQNRGFLFLRGKVRDISGAENASFGSGYTCETFYPPRAFVDALFGAVESTFLLKDAGASLARLILASPTAQIELNLTFFSPTISALERRLSCSFRATITPVFIDEDIAPYPDGKDQTGSW